MFSVLPPDAKADGPVVATPATHRPADLDGGADDAPSVSAQVLSSQPLAAVFTFYGQQATSSGWTAVGTNAAGLANS